MKKVIIVSCSVCAVAGLLLIWSVSTRNTMLVNAQDDPSPTPSSYQDLLDTEIRGIDAETIEGYRNGSGLGMALPAELNGYPGPRHVLDLASELELTDEQYESIQALYDAMLPEAIELGEHILAKEAELELAFREGTITEAFLETHLTEVGNLRSQLRFVHLRTHLATIEILSAHQVMRYNELRGYAIDTDNHNHNHD